MYIISKELIFTDREYNFYAKQNNNDNNISSALLYPIQLKE